MFIHSKQLASWLFICAIGLAGFQTESFAKVPKTKKTQQSKGKKKLKKTSKAKKNTKLSLAKRHSLKSKKKNRRRAKVSIPAKKADAPHLLQGSKKTFAEMENSQAWADAMTDKFETKSKAFEVCYKNFESRNAAHIETKTSDIARLEVQVLMLRSGKAKNLELRWHEAPASFPVPDAKMKKCISTQVASADWPRPARMTIFKQYFKFRQDGFRTANFQRPAGRRGLRRPTCSLTGRIARGACGI